MTNPRLIALCGYAGSGKSTAQSILQRFWGYEPVDDGFPLRNFAMQHLGLSKNDVYTQEGKAKFTEILGKNWQNREILGEFGNMLEAMFGKDIMCYMASQNLDPNKRYSFGSVRRDQGNFYKSLGGIVIGIKNPDVSSPKFEFDNFDPTTVDYWVKNDALSKGMSKEKAMIDLYLKLKFVMITHAARVEAA
jgi:hypothetical protein